MMDKKEIVKLVSYFVMGDGGVYYGNRESRNARFQMSILECNRDYAEWACDVMSQIAGCQITTPTFTSGFGSERQPMLTVRSKSHPFFTTIRERMYVGGYKTVDPHTLKLLDAEALAIIYMSDGSLGVNKQSKTWHYDIKLCKSNLGYGDQLLLKKALKERLELEWNIHKSGGYWHLNLRRKDNDRFCELVTPYMLPSFYYKLPSQRLAPAETQDGDIVRTLQECRETGRNDRSLVTT